MADTAKEPARAQDIIVKTVITHTVTYFVMGVFAYLVFDYSRLYAETSYKYIMRQTSEPLVMAGPLFQPLRGLIFGVAFCIPRRSFFEQEHGWLRMSGRAGVPRYPGHVRAGAGIGGGDD